MRLLALNNHPVERFPVNSVRRIVASTSIVAAAIALSGCATVGIDIVDRYGTGECDTDKPVSLDVSQDSGGNNVTIVYEGPTDVSLIAYQGIYSDGQFFGMIPTESIAFGYPLDDTDSNPDIAFNALDFTASPWVTTTTGSRIRATYNQPMSTFIDDLDYTQDDVASENSDLDVFLPVTVGVLCESGFSSVVASSPSVDIDGILENFPVAAAQPMFPNFMYIDAPRISNQVDIANGVEANMTLPTELADALPNDFIPASMFANALYIGPRDPLLPPNDEYPYTLDGAQLGDFWYLTIMVAQGGGGASSSIEFPGELSVTDPMAFTFTGEGAAPESGYYLFFMGVGDAEENPEDFKIVTSILKYDVDEGLSFETVTDNPRPERLADTGGDPNVIIWAVLGGLVVLAAVFLRPKRRNDQAESTIEPSDKKK